MGGGKEDTFGDTAAAMVEGPVAGMKAFAGGLSGGPSPSRDYLANDPLTKTCPARFSPALARLATWRCGSVVARRGHLWRGWQLALSLFPGRARPTSASLRKIMTGMAMFAVPELAGGSSIPARMAATAPKAAPVVAKAAPRLPKT